MEMDEEPEDEFAGFRTPLPPEDRIWRHPSELEYRDEPAPVAPARASRAVWAVSLVSGLIGAMLATGIVVASGGLEADVVERTLERERVALPVLRTNPGGSATADVVGIAEEVRPAVVRLEVDSREGEASATGSGVIFRDSGYLLTNNHVVKGARRVTVITADARELTGEVVGGDAETDIAVVKVDGGPFRTAVLGSAIDLKVGQAAMAVGSPLGLEGGPSLTVGVISALGRSINSVGDENLYDMIQTDAPILPGSSGGALLDSGGAVIGITTAIAVSDVGAEGLGFATPIDIARDVADDIIRTGKAVHVWLGVRGADVDDETAEKWGLDGGAQIHDVVPGSPADEAGLLEGDVVVTVGAREIRTMSGLVVELRQLDPGDDATIGFVRDGAPGSVSVTVEKKPSDL